MKDDDLLEGAKRYDFGAPVKAVEKAYPDGRFLVRLHDGSHAMAIPTSVVQKSRDCSVAALKQWQEKVEATYGPGKHLDFLRMLCADKRMVSFWGWVSGVTFKRPMMRNVTTISDALFRATQLPQKPGDMTPAQRAAYFDKVRKHVGELRELLRGTLFDYTIEQELSESRLDESLDKALYHYGDDEDEDGHIVAFKVTPGGRYSLDYMYPYSELTSILDYVDQWTRDDDYFGRSIFHSSAPIRQSNSDSTRIIYFTCTIADFFAGYGVEIPDAILAELTEVCLQLGPNQPLDADTVKRQVARYRQRTGRVGREAAAPAGQNYPEGSDFVLQGDF